MLNKKQKDSKKDSDRETNRSQDSDIFDRTTLSNSSTHKNNNKKLNIKKTHLLEYSSSDQEDWKTQYTKQIRKQETQEKQEALKTKTSFKRKYPKETTNFKAGFVEVKSKDNSNSRFEDLCAICLDKYSDIRGQLGCGHKFCYECIEEWIKSSTRCPCCRETFSEYVRVTVNGSKIERKREIIEVDEKVLEFSELDWYICYECDNGEDQDVLLVCDICQFYCCHVYCDQSLNNFFPHEDWYCHKCRQMLEINSIHTKKNTKAPIKQPKQKEKKPEKKTKKIVQAESQSDQDQYHEHTPINGRVTRSMSNIQVNLQGRSKTYKIMNMRPSTTKNNFSNEMERVTNSTAVNLRNLRRRRIS